MKNRNCRNRRTRRTDTLGGSAPLCPHSPPVNPHHPTFDFVLFRLQRAVCKVTFCCQCQLGYFPTVARNLARHTSFDAVIHNSSLPVFPQRGATTAVPWGHVRSHLQDRARLTVWLTENGGATSDWSASATYNLIRRAPLPTVVAPSTPIQMTPPSSLTVANAKCRLRRFALAIG